MITSKTRDLVCRTWQPAVLWGLVYLAITSVGLHDYINWGSPVFLLGVLCLVQVSLPGHSGAVSLRFAYISIAFGMLSVFLPVKTMLYLSGSAALLFVLEAGYGKVRHAAVCTLVIMSPVFEYAANVFSFPIRLQLTGWAGSMMSICGQKVFCEGNTLTLNGNEFTVDPGCMGLNMMQTSLLLGIMISFFYQGRCRLQLRMPALLITLVVITGLNIVSNLFRITAIVLFNIQPGTVMHEVVGLACLLLYVVVPGAALIRVIVKRSGKQLLPDSHTPKLKNITGLYLLVTAAVTLTAFNMVKHDQEKHSFALTPSVAGYAVERIDAGILKLNGPASLVYIKGIHGFYSTDHNPMICWKGSGYAFRKVCKSSIQGNAVYTAILTKGEEQLYTAWWYDNTKKRTISQFSWRWDVFCGGEAYSLINVTCSNYEDMYRSIQEICSTGSLNKLVDVQ